VEAEWAFIRQFCLVPWSWMTKNNGRGCQLEQKMAEDGLKWCASGPGIWDIGAGRLHRHFGSPRPNLTPAQPRLGILGYSSSMIRSLCSPPSFFSYSFPPHPSASGAIANWGFPSWLFSSLTLAIDIVCQKVFFNKSIQAHSFLILSWQPFSLWSILFQDWRIEKSKQWRMSYQRDQSFSSPCSSICWFPEGLCYLGAARAEARTRSLPGGWGSATRRWDFWSRKWIRQDA